MQQRLTSSLVLVTILGLASANPPSPYPADVPANYHFKYEVKDDYSGQDFGQEEARSGYNTDGEYTVVLPDGRKQIVTYKVADGESGFVADVRYEGEANPDSYHPPASYQPKPTYKPAPYQPPKPTYGPVYKPKPTYGPKPYARPAPTYGPVYKPQPTYAPVTTTTTTTPKPVYEPVTRAYKPVPRTYGPAPKPTTSLNLHAPTSVKSRAEANNRARQYSNLLAQQEPEVEQVEVEEKEEEDEVTEAPVYNPSSVERRRMKYANRLAASASNDSGSLFYGNVKGRVQAPRRRNN